MPTSPHEPHASHPTAGGVSIGLVIIIGLLLGLAVRTLTAGFGIDETQTIRPTAAIDRVRVHLDAGAVTLTRAETLSVEVARRSSRIGPRPAVTSFVSDRTLRLTGRCSRFGIGRCDTSVDVSLPPGTAIVVSTKAGAIRGTIETGHVEARTAAGSIDLEVTGDLTALLARTEAGPIDLIVPDAAYAVDVSGTLGRTRVDVERSPDAARRIDARAEVGDVTVRRSLRSPAQ